MSSKARELANLGNAYSDGALSNRNLIINGAMQVAQRGTSFTDADTYSLDRWRLNQSSETMAVSQQSFTSGQTDVPRAEKYLRVVITTTGNFAGITQRIEGVEQLSGQTVTLSFYARGGQGGQGVPTTFRSYLNQNFGSGGSAAVNAQGIANHALTTSWQLFTSTITLGSTSGKTIGTSPYTELVFQQTTGEACDFDIALVQLEVGDTATPFEHRSYGQELALCQRYFCKIENTTGASKYFGILQAYTSGFAYGVLADYPQIMRATPSVTQGGSFGFYDSYSSDAGANTAIGNFTSTSRSWITEGWGGASGLTAGHACGTFWLSGAYLTADAEL